MKRRLILALLLAPACAAAQTSPQPGAPSPPDTWLPRNTADLVLLEKLRAQPSDVSVKTGQQTSFGSLTIAVKSCFSRPPDLPQNSAVFLEITDSRGQEKSATSAKPASVPVSVFRGWILSNTPAVSQFAHPLYDIRLVSCH